MANFDFSHVKTIKEEGRMKLEEIHKRVKELNEEHRKLIDLPMEEFLSDETGRRLREIHEEELKLCKMILRGS